MLINECRPYINRRRDLRFMLPNFRGSMGGISCWDEGFEPCQIRNGRQSDSRQWSLNLLSFNEGRRLPGSVQAFIQQIPVDVRERIAPFKFGQVPMLQGIARYPAINDLSLSHPKLFWLLVASTFDSDWGVEDIRRICQYRQVDILERINGSSSKAAVRLLRKIDVTEGSLGEARTILRAIGEPNVVRVAAHLQTVSIRLLALLSNYPDLADSAAANLLNRILNSEAGRSPGTAVDLAVRLVDIKRMARLRRIPSVGQAMNVCKSVEDVNRLHDRWVASLNAEPQTTTEELAEVARIMHARQDRRERLDTPAFLRSDALPAMARVRQRAVTRRPRIDISTLTFPPAPFPDSKTIQAITTVDELIEEGRVQDNCVASYAETVAKGDSYIYRVMKPQRGTLELRYSDGAWVTGQFKLKKNAPAGAKAKAAVRRWYQQVRCNL